MVITRTSPFSGKENSMDLDITPEQYQDWSSGRLLIQEAMPNLNPEEREFVMTGIMPIEWDEIFGEPTG